MRITISSRLLLEDFPGELRDIILQDLILDNPKYVSNLKNGYSVYGIPEKIINYDLEPGGLLYIPRGYLNKLLKLVREMDIVVEDINDCRKIKWDPLEVDSSKIVLRDYQREALINMTIRGTEGFLVSPAGSGKTIIGLSLIPMLGQKTLWLTHTNPLAKQVIERMQAFLPSLKEGDVGYIGDGKWSIGNTITVAMIQTLIRRKDDLYKLSDEFGLVILDEAHHCPARTFTDVIKSFSPYYLYGLTATPIRRDGLHKMMFQIMGDVLYAVDRKDVKKHGNIITPTIFKVTVKNNYSYIYNFGELVKALVGDGTRNNLIVEHVVAEEAKGNVCAVLTERVAHAKTLYELIDRQIGTKVVMAVGKTKNVEEALEKFTGGESTVLVTTSALLGEGFDHAPINRGFITLPFRNMAKTEQIVGRVQRSFPGKKDAIIYDYVDTHGLLQNQFQNRNINCRCAVYKKLGCTIQEI